MYDTIMYDMPYYVWHALVGMALLSRPIMHDTIMYDMPYYV